MNAGATLGVKLAIACALCVGIIAGIVYLVERLS